MIFWAAAMGTAMGMLATGICTYLVARRACQRAFVKGVGHGINISIDAVARSAGEDVAAAMCRQAIADHTPRGGVN